MRSPICPIVLLVGLALLVSAPLALSQESIIAYEIPGGTAGNQAFDGALGMDFDVEFDILVTRLGVFDDLSDGLNLPITARLYDRDFLEEIASLEFTPDDPGELIGGSRFKDLEDPLDLPAGFRGTIVAGGYGDTELNGNQGVVDLGLGTDSGNCMISFVGTGRFGADPAFYPDTPDGGPVNRYAAGTFAFTPEEVPPAPTGGIAYVVPFGTFGNDTFNGPLGMDFDVNVDLLVTRLGVFDDGSDGLNATITARLYGRDSQLELASLEFTPGDPGELIDSSRFKDLEEPLALPAGTRCTIVAEGYGDAELNGNQTVGPIDGLTMDNGRCAIQFTGRGRSGISPGEFPDTVNFLPPNAPDLFAAGTLEFEPSDTPFERPNPPTNLQATAEEGRVRLSWTPPVMGPAVAGYNVYQTSPGAISRLNPVLVTATSFTASGLLGGVEHCFVVRSVLDSGIESGDSKEACGTPPVKGMPDETVVAYEVVEGTAGNQEFGGALGMDFNVNSVVVVTRLGVFDDGSDGLHRTITARLYDREFQLELGSLVFTPDDPGELVGGSRFKDLDSPVSLPAGFRGTIVAEGYGPDDPATKDVDEGEMNGNQTVGPVDGLTTNSFSCSISFVGGRFGSAGIFPAAVQLAPMTNPFAAGTFVYGPTGEVDPDPGRSGVAYVIAAGVAGDQDFGGALGMDFNVEADMLVTRLGVFDDSSDGLFLSINARIYDRDAQVMLATFDFTPEDPGELVGGSRFKDLEEPLGLPAGFRGTMVASGYGTGELNGNQGDAPIQGLSTDDGGCMLSFVGGGRFGGAGTPGIFPDVPDGGPVNRYAAGTFAYEPSDVPIVLPPNPPGNLLIIAGDGEVLLTWAAPGGTTPAARYKVFRAPAGGNFTEIADVDETEFRDTGRTNGEETCYRVRSVAADGQESADTPTICATPGAIVEGRVIAYHVPGGTLGTEAGTGEAFGLDFDVDLDIRITRIGVFDSGTDGLSDDLVVRLYDRDTELELEILEFSPGAPGVLIGGSRFKDLADPIELSAGFHGSIVAEGFTEADPVQIGGNFETDPGPCSVSFVGARRDLAGFFPLVTVAGNYPFAGGTFEFEALETVPPGDGGIAYVVPPGTFGNQAFGGALGMDFNVQHAIRVTRLGVFDDGSDGLNLPLNARLYDRATQEVLARLDFTLDDPGELVDGSLFKDLETLVALPAGFRGTIVGQGYGDAERNGNQGAFDLGLETEDGSCLITFVGGGRFGDPTLGDIFPDVPDGGPADRYAAGTFEYERGEGEICDNGVDDDGDGDIDCADPDCASSAACEGVTFRRGDTDTNGRMELTDAIGIFNFLFITGVPPDCFDAADADDNNAIELTDGIRILNVLFLGFGEIPPPGFLACGADPTEDSFPPCVYGADC